MTGEVTNVAVKIKLKRIGKIRVPQYRIVIADARTARNGRAIEEIGIYHPKEDPSVIRVDSDRVQHWLTVGAQPTEPVMAILKITGDWQKFKGLPGQEGTLRVADAKTDKQQVFEAAAKEAVGEKGRLEELQAQAAKKAADARDAAKEAEKAAAKAAEAPAAEVAPAEGAPAEDTTAAEAPATEAPAADAPATESPAADAPAADTPSDEAKADSGTEA